MPVKFIKQGDIFASKAEAICNAVNCVGVMGGGLAAIFARKFPQMNADYKVFCEEKKLKPGGIHVFDLAPARLGSTDPTDKPYVFNVATKDHWMTDSQYEWIVDGLKNIAVEAAERGITTVAVPALGCGLGGLEWSRVKKIVEEVAAEHWQGLDVEVYEPL